MTTRDRFFTKVYLPPNCQDEDCWVWTGSLDDCGYGRFMLHGSNTKAHRVSWLLFTTVPIGPLLVLHKCDQRNCVNPHHLFLGTNRDNTLDMCAKGRHHNSLKTHCSRGHLLSPDNLYYAKNSSRKCKQCCFDYAKGLV